MNFENKTENPIKVIKSERKQIKSWATVYPGKTIATEDERFAKSYVNSGLCEQLTEIKAIEGKAGIKKVETKVLMKKK